MLSPPPLASARGRRARWAVLSARCAVALPNVCLFRQWRSRWRQGLPVRLPWPVRWAGVQTLDPVWTNRTTLAACPYATDRFVGLTLSFRAISRSLGRRVGFNERRDRFAFLFGSEMTPMHVHIETTTPQDRLRFPTHANRQRPFPSPSLPFVQWHTVLRIERIHRHGGDRWERPRRPWGCRRRDGSAASRRLRPSSELHRKWPFRAVGFFLVVHKKDERFGASRSS